jgi:hypothetical protein
VQIVHILTVEPTLPVAVLDDVLTAVDKALLEIGATRVWIDPDRPALAIMAELPDAVAEEVVELFRA